MRYYHLGKHTGKARRAYFTVSHQGKVGMGKYGGAAWTVTGMGTHGQTGVHRTKRSAIQSAVRLSKARYGGHVHVKVQKGRGGGTASSRLRGGTGRVKTHSRVSKRGKVGRVKSHTRKRRKR